jgi:hypothetical protein
VGTAAAAPSNGWAAAPAPQALARDFCALAERLTGEPQGEGGGSAPGSRRGTAESLSERGGVMEAAVAGAKHLDAQHDVQLHELLEMLGVGPARWPAALRGGGAVVRCARWQLARPGRRARAAVLRRRWRRPPRAAR